MGQVTSGLRAVLSLASFYDLVQDALGVGQYRHEIVRSYIRADGPHPFRVLDMGCGTARILSQLPNCTYTGVDMSRRYIDAATRRYGRRATFVCTEATGAPFERWNGEVDCLLMLGLLHHLDDADVLSLLRGAAPALAPGGRVVTVDPTMSAETHPVGRFLAARDRGRNVREPDAYRNLAGSVFDEVKLHVRHDLLRVPYSHAILECSRPSANPNAGGRNLMST